jgi:hypothetical protein
MSEEFQSLAALSCSDSGVFTITTRVGASCNSMSILELFNQPPNRSPRRCAATWRKAVTNELD